MHFLRDLDREREDRDGDWGYLGESQEMRRDTLRRRFINGVSLHIHHRLAKPEPADLCRNVEANAGPLRGFRAAHDCELEVVIESDQLRCDEVFHQESRVVGP